MTLYTIMLHYHYDCLTHAHNYVHTHSLEYHWLHVSNACMCGTMDILQLVCSYHMSHSRTLAIIALYQGFPPKSLSIHWLRHFHWHIYVIVCLSAAFHRMDCYFRSAHPPTHTHALVHVHTVATCMNFCL